MLTLRLTDPNDYTVHEDDQPIGRIGLARERSLSIWLWHVTVNIPGAPFGDATSIDDAKARFKAAWIAFRDKQDPAKLAKVYADMNFANRPDRYKR